MRRYTLYIYNIVAGLAAILALAACSDSLVESGVNTGDLDDYWAQYDFIIHDGNGTRVSYEGNVDHATFDEGDEVGVYAVSPEGTLIPDQPTNVSYTVRDITNINTGTQRQVLQPTNPEVAVTKSPNYRYVLYYPYNPNMTLSRLKSYTHTVLQDQDSKEAFEASDLLWCYYTPPEGNVYEVDFDHAMAQIIVETNDEATSVYLLNMPLTASGINLVQSLSDDFTYQASVPSYPAMQEEENTLIKAHYFGYAQNGNKQFRAVIPAHTFDKEGQGIPAVRIATSNESKDYKISTGQGGFTFRPGYDYTLTLSKGNPIPEIESGEDDSWVLDVLDPETGKPVGLLCREYLVYQPDATTHQHTGNAIPGRTDSKYIDSQAWVFYNLRDDGTPELSTGTVLRFTYDVQINFNAYGELGSTQAYLPAPHENTNRQGIFLPRHGYYWTSANEVNHLLEGKYGTEVKIPGSDDPRMNEQNYHMHGGKIKWGYTDGHSHITDFTLPKKKEYTSVDEYNEATIGDGSGYITNKQADLFGHIAIDENGNASVSYQPISEQDKYKDIAGNKVGVLQPHYLIDRRINTEGVLEENRYPLVKIGHNQFWMSKPLRTTTMTDGTPLICCNKITTDGSKPATVDDKINWNNEIGASYIYPFSQTIKNGEEYYDPVNDPEEMNPSVLEYNGAYSPAPCYNSTAVNDDRFVPKSNDSRLYYQMPTATQFEDMSGYFGQYFAAKISTNQIAKRVSSPDSENENYNKGNFVSEVEGLNVDYYAVKYGKTHKGSSAEANYYAANISGLNLRAIGSYHSKTGFKEMTGSEVVMLKNLNPNQAGIDYMEIHAYDSFEIQDFNRCKQVNQNYHNGAYPTHFFAQVRMVMKFRNQLDNGGTASYTTNNHVGTRAGNKAKASRHVWLRLKP